MHLECIVIYYMTAYSRESMNEGEHSCIGKASLPINNECMFDNYGIYLQIYGK